MGEVVCSFASRRRRHSTRCRASCGVHAVLSCRRRADRDSQNGPPLWGSKPKKRWGVKASRWGKSESSFSSPRPAAVEMPPPPPPAPLPVPPPGLAAADPPAAPAGGQAAGQQSLGARFRGEVGGRRVPLPPSSLPPPHPVGETLLPPSTHSPHHQNRGLLLKRLPSCSHLASSCSHLAQYKVVRPWSRPRLCSVVLTGRRVAHRR